MARGGPGLTKSASLLGQIYQIEVRFDDVRVLLRAGLADAKDLIRILKDLSNLELDRLPYAACKRHWKRPASCRQRTSVSGSARAGWRSKPAAGSKLENG